MPALKSKPKTKFSQKLTKVKPPKKQEPLWKGPEDAGPLGGITQSMLNNFCSCRHRFFVKYVQGMQVVQGFSRVMEYGNMWHLCEEMFALCPENGATLLDGFFEPLTKYCQGLCQKYPLAQDEIAKWYNICMVQFPLYVEWWSKHKDVQQRTPLMQEEVFHVPYTLPSGRVVYLRGKFDSVDLVGKGKNAGIYLKENKSKGDIDESRMQRQLKMDLQTMTYIICLQEMQKQEKLNLPWVKIPIRGVNYNVVRRPLAGGRGSITQGKGSDGSVCSGCDGKGERTMYAGTKREVFEKPCSKCGGKGKTGFKPPETDEEFSERLRGIIESAVGPEWGMPDGQHYFFMRWKVEISQIDIDRFKTQFLNPILEQLCTWYQFVKDGDPFKLDLTGMGIHYMLPFGIYSPLAENGFTDVDEFLMEGNDIGLHRATTLFTELQ